MSNQASEPAPAAQPKPYAIVGAPVYVRQFSEQLQQVVGGWQVQAQWLANGSIITVFVPDGSDLASTADTLIRAQGEQLNALHQLG